MPAPARGPAPGPPKTWEDGLRRFVRVGQAVQDFADGIWVVLSGVFAGAIAGAVLASWRGVAVGFWIGLTAGALAGGAAGAYLAWRVIWKSRKPEARPAPLTPTPGALRWPGVEEQFRKIRFRAWVLAGLLVAALLAQVYLESADVFDWPVPSSPKATECIWLLVGVELAIALLMFLTIRCPKCRGVLWRAAELYECPHCGVTLRG